MADVEEPKDSRFDDVDLESILARVERRGPLTFTRKRCLYRAPEFVKKLPKEETVEEGSTVKFECKAVGFPKPTLNWTKDLEILPDNPRITFQYGELGEASIEIQKIKKSEEGSYRCKAENAEGSASSSIYISIKAKPNSPKRSQERVTFKSTFNPIPERIDEEEREAEEIRKQPKSPLTYLYDGVTIKAQSWPDFLGNWAFLASDTSNIYDNLDYIDDEDVFLPGLVENSDNDIYNCGMEMDSDKENVFGNDLKNSPIPNLVFENKNLTNMKADKNLNSSIKLCEGLVKDENANHRLLVVCESSDQHSNDNQGNIGTDSELGFLDNGHTSKLKCSVKLTEISKNNKQIKTDLSNGSSKGSGTEKTESINDNQNHSNCSSNKSKSACSSARDTMSSSVSSSQKRPLMSKQASSPQRPLSATKNVLSNNSTNNCEHVYTLNLMLFCLLISGITFAGLCADVAPLNFVILIFAGQLIYMLLKYLCNYS
ncbi:uncharacterized protein LOC143054506 isoform X1 [Mytilus galloprovincialis]|uniref:uncharacterized protein LOC143054506 isoform X1 n=1 Tax=Mytilus galloprovincialis TaxID=29158 RepID=UPI003F7C09FA